MRLICLRCGNYRFFEIETEILRAITVRPDGLVIGDARWQDCDLTFEGLHADLENFLNYLVNQNGCELRFDPDTETYYNPNVRCGRCGAEKVTTPLKPKAQHATLEDELNANREEYQILRKERRIHENHLPVLWQP